MFNLADKIGVWLSSKRSPQPVVKLTQKNIFIFPSKAGFAYLGVLVIMLLTAINYQNSLIYLFVFTLGALFVISIWMCFLNFAQIKVMSGQPSYCFAKENTAFEVMFEKDESPSTMILCVLNDSENLINELPVKERTTCTLLDKPKSRGVYQIDRFYLRSYYPFGLIRAWAWPRLDAQSYVFPEPVDGSSMRKGASFSASPENKVETDDFNDISPYQEGQPANRIIWKRYAAKDELVVRQQDKSSMDSEWIRWDDYETGNVEQKLSYMCFDVLQLAANRQKYGLELRGKTISPSQGEAHKLSCLKALAEY